MTDAQVKKRFDFATELRDYARRVDDLALADRRDPEAPIIGKADLAKDMRRRANEIVRGRDAVERGEITAQTLFRKAGPVAVAVRKVHPRVGGTLGLAKAA